MNLDNAQIVVTGGTGALGRAVVALLVRQGATCHVPNLFASELEDFPLRDHERVHVSEGIDLTDAMAVESYYEKLPGLWASVHVAGGFHFAPIAETMPADFERQWRMNAQTCFNCCRAAVAVLRRAGQGGRIVNVAARPALEPRQGARMTAYTAAKAAVAALTEALAQEIADEQIWVNAVAPSILDTPENRAGMPDADHERWPRLEDVAQTILFLVSPDNRATRGGLIPVYGRV